MKKDKLILINKELKTNKETLIEKLLTEKANENNTIDLNAYALVTMSKL